MKYISAHKVIIKLKLHFFIFFSSSPFIFLLHFISFQSDNLKLFWDETSNLIGLKKEDMNGENEETKRDQKDCFRKRKRFENLPLKGDPRKAI